MRKYYFLIFVVLGIAMLMPSPTQAQEQLPAEIISVNEPISADLRAALISWLQTSRPSPAVYYAVTYSQEVGQSVYVSLVGLNIETPEAFWSLTGDEEGNQQVIWFDTVTVSEEGDISFPFAGMGTRSIKLASLDFPGEFPHLPSYGPGGGNYVRFPWQPAKAVQYGILGAHAAGYQATLDTDSTWLAVDLVSGTDMGSGAADDRVFASVGGTVSAVCQDATSVAVKLTGNGDSFVYAHLLDNANLTVGHSFASGQYIGSLKHGSFSDDCGWAAQTANHYHLHWGFITTGSAPRYFYAEGCRLLKSAFFTSGVWECGDTTIKPLGFLYHYGNIGVNPDTGEVGSSYAGGGPSFWEYFLGGMGELFSTMFTDNLPEHNSSIPFITPVLNGVKIVMRISFVLLQGNFNFLPAITAILFTLTFRLALAGVFGVIGIVRAIKA